MIDKNSIERLYGALVFDSAGDKIGKVGTIYLNDHTNEATFVTVTTGLFGRFESLVPLQAARLNGDDLLVEYTKDQVKDAPRVDAGRQLSPDEEVRLYEYYRLGGNATLTGGSDAAGSAAGTDTTETATASGVRAIHPTASGTQTGRPRLRKHTAGQD